MCTLNFTPVSRPSEPKLWAYFWYVMHDILVLPLITRGLRNSWHLPYQQNSWCQVLRYKDFCKWKSKHLPIAVLFNCDFGNFQTKENKALWNVRSGLDISKHNLQSVPLSSLSSVSSDDDRLATAEGFVSSIGPRKWKRSYSLDRKLMKRFIGGEKKKCYALLRQDTRAEFDFLGFHPFTLHSLGIIGLIVFPKPGVNLHYNTARWSLYFNFS